MAKQGTTNPKFDASSFLGRELRNLSFRVTTRVSSSPPEFNDYKVLPFSSSSPTFPSSLQRILLFFHFSLNTLRTNLFEMSSLRQREESSSSSKTSEILPVQQTGSNENPMEEHKQGQLNVTRASDPEGQVISTAVDNDVFGNEEGAEVHYKTCKW